jgi:hypothetical protein
MSIDAPPFDNVTTLDLKVPLISITAPVVIGAPMPPLAVIATDRGWVVKILAAEGVAVIEGATLVTDTEFVPVALV